MGLLVAAVVVLATIEVGYFVKTLFWGLGTRLFRSRIHPLQFSTTYGLVTTRDIDFLLTHMNNSRYLRAMDFARVEHFVRCHLNTAVRQLGGGAVVASTVIRYRKPVMLFSPYAIDTGIVFWDGRSIYYRQDVRTLHDNFIRATAYLKITLLGCTPLEGLQSAIEAYNVAMPGKGGVAGGGAVKGVVLETVAADTSEVVQGKGAARKRSTVHFNGALNDGVADTKPTAARGETFSNGQCDVGRGTGDMVQGEGIAMDQMTASGSEILDLLLESSEQSDNLAEFFNCNQLESFVERPLPVDLKSFIKYNELSSLRMKAGCIVDNATKEAVKRVRTNKTSDVE